MVGQPHCGPTKKKYWPEVDPPKDQTNFKDWRYPTYILDDDFMPCHIVSFFYILPRATWECIFATAMRTPIHPANDYYLGYILRACGITPLRHNGILDGNKQYTPGVIMCVSLISEEVWFQSIGDNSNGHPVLAVHKANISLVYNLIHVQNYNVFLKQPNCHHIEKLPDGTWKKCFCDSNLKCGEVKGLYINHNRVEEENYVSYSKKPLPCWCPSVLSLRLRSLFQDYLYPSYTRCRDRNWEAELLRRREEKN